MTEPHLQLLDDLGAEFARVAAERECSPRRSRLRSFTAVPGRAVAVAFSVLVLLGAAAYAVPPTRTAIENLTSTFAGWLGEDEGAAPGRALRPEGNAPDWVQEGGGRVIVAKHGVELYVTRSETEKGIYLNFVLDDAVAVGNTIDGWREQFEKHAAIVLGPAPFRTATVGPHGWLDERGRFPLMGVTARSVERVELRYEQGPPLVETGVDGGFILLADAWRTKRELVAYNAAGRELERVDLSYLDTRQLCDRDPSCPSP
jgi:hypothetical protein